MGGVWVPLMWQVRKPWDRAAERAESEQEDSEGAFWSLAWVVCQVQCKATVSLCNPQGFFCSPGQSCTHAFAVAGAPRKKENTLLVHDKKISPKDKDPKANSRTKIGERRDI